MPVLAAVIDSTVQGLPGTTQMITFNGCAAPVPGQPETMSVEPYDTLWAQFFYFPNGQSGTKIVDICFFDFNNPTDTVCERMTLITNTSVSIHEQEFDDELIKIYPNPFDSDLTVEISSRIEGDGDVIVFDAKGRLVHGGKMNSKTKTFSMPLGLTEGTYHISILKDGKLLSSKSVIKR